MTDQVNDEERRESLFWMERHRRVQRLLDEEMEGRDRALLFALGFGILLGLLFMGGLVACK
jgi:hypothetical protein